jgi:hypothetical protein
MQAVAHSLSFAKKVGVPQSVGREYTREDKEDKDEKHGKGHERNEKKRGYKGDKS